MSGISSIKCIIIAQMETIVFFIPNLGKGGAERILVNVANKIASNYGNQYHVKIALSKKEGYYLDYVDSRVEVLDLRSERVSGSVFKLARLIRTLRKDRVHLISFLGYANIIAVLSTYLSFSRKKVDLIVSERNHIPWGDDLKCRMVFALQKLLYKYCNSIVTISKAISIEIVEKLHVDKNNVYTIYNPLTVPVKINSTEVRFNNNECNIVTAGRLIPVKDFPLLLNAFAIISNNRKSRLWVLGEGPEKDNLIQLANNLGIRDKVEMCGFVDDPISYFKGADAYVCSSVSEGFANVVLEAMASGTRIITMSCGGPDEILENGKWGKIVYKREPEELANGILDYLKEPAINCSKRMENFSIDTIVKEYIHVLR